MGLSGGTYTRDDGSRTGSSICEQQKAASAKPSAELFDNMFNDMATALSTAFYKDGQATATGSWNLGGYKITNMAAGADNGDSVRYEQVVKVAGDTMSGALAMGSNKITGLAAGTTNGDALRYEQLAGVYLPIAGGTMTGDIAMGTYSISGATNITATGTIQAEQITSTDDITLAGVITGATNITASGTIQAEQLTSTDDITLAGVITGATNITASGTIQGEQITSTDDITLAGVITGATNITMSGNLTLSAGYIIPPGSPTYSFSAGSPTTTRSIDYTGIAVAAGSDSINLAQLNARLTSIFDILGTMWNDLLK
jgi:hypothetical protein